MILKHRSRKRNERHGAAAVEFAITAPIFFILFFSAVEVTRVNQISNTAEVAATEGARRGIIPGASAAECIAAASDEMRAVGVDSFTVTVMPSQIQATTATVRVEVVVNTGPENGLFVSGLFTGKRVIRSIELAREE
jgi:Flp pilus assembly protein TadG